MTTFHSHQPIVIGNWKQNTGRDRAVALAREIVGASVKGVQQAICPPAIWLTSVAEAVFGTSIRVGAQNLSRYPSGAYTGELSAEMIAEACSFTLVGHSERRKLFDETDEIVNAKLHVALGAGLGVVMCVGESAEQRDAGEAVAVVTSQLEKGLAGVNAIADIVVAYEPVWAIGTGRSATSADARTMTTAIAGVISKLLGGIGAPVLYGGSVTSGNAAELFAGEHVAGFLVGGASLEAEEFTAIGRAIAPGD